MVQAWGLYLCSLPLTTCVQVSMGMGSGPNRFKSGCFVCAAAGRPGSSKRGFFRHSTRGGLPGGDQHENK
jgi:hypothetical protein